MILKAIANVTLPPTLVIIYIDFPRDGLDFEIFSTIKFPDIINYSSRNGVSKANFVFYYLVSQNKTSLSSILGFWFGVTIYCFNSMINVGLGGFNRI